MDYRKIATDILNLTGGRENILDSENCMTRIRLKLKEYDEGMISRLKKLEGVYGVNTNGDEVQIILGPGRSTEVFKEFQPLLAQQSANKAAATAIQSTGNKAEAGSGKAKASGFLPKGQVGDGKALHAQIKAKNATPFKLLLRKVADIFIPLIPGFIACGLITSIAGILLKVDPSLSSNSNMQLLCIMGNAVFWGMNLFVGLNAAKAFGGTPILGGVMAVIITHPGLAKITMFDAPMAPGRGGIIAVLLAAAFAALLEKQLRKIVPEMLNLFLVPFFTVLIAGFATCYILQPIGGVIANAIGAAATGAVASGGAVTGAILGGTWLPVVMMGIHQAMTPIHAQLIADQGVTILLPILAMAGGGQVGASAAVLFKTKNQRLKKTIASALPIGMMGVGEPLIYGVTLPLGKPFICACIGGACGGAVQAAFMVGASAMGISGLPLAAVTNDIPCYLLGLVVAYVAGFIVTYIVGFDDPEPDDME